jgi:hypothetical protein
MLEHGVHRMKQLDGDHDQRLLGRFALGLLAEINGAPLATTAHGIDGSEVERVARNARALCVSLLAELEAFFRDHRPHGSLTADATEPAWNGYLLTVACPCGVVFERWVTSVDADADLIGIARLN